MPKTFRARVSEGQALAIRPEISDDTWLREYLDELLSYAALWGEALTVNFSSELRIFFSHVHNNVREAATRAVFMDLTSIMEVAFNMSTSVRQLKDQLLLEITAVLAQPKCWRLDGFQGSSCLWQRAACQLPEWGQHVPLQHRGPVNQFSRLP